MADEKKEPQVSGEAIAQSEVSEKETVLELGDEYPTYQKEENETDRI